jgi:hypothetical protein
MGEVRSKERSFCWFLRKERTVAWDVFPRSDRHFSRTLRLIAGYDGEIDKVLVDRSLGPRVLRRRFRYRDHFVGLVSSVRQEAR